MSGSGNYLRFVGSLVGVVLITALGVSDGFAKSDLSGEGQQSSVSPLEQEWDLATNDRDPNRARIAIQESGSRLNFVGLRPVSDSSGSPNVGRTMHLRLTVADDIQNVLNSPLLPNSGEGSGRFRQRGSSTTLYRMPKAASSNSIPIAVNGQRDSSARETDNVLRPDVYTMILAGLGLMGFVAQRRGLRDV